MECSLFNGEARGTYQPGRFEAGEHDCIAVERYALHYEACPRVPRIVLPKGEDPAGAKGVEQPLND